MIISLRSSQPLLVTRITLPNFASCVTHIYATRESRPSKEYVERSPDWRDWFQLLNDRSRELHDWRHWIPCTTAATSPVVTLSLPLPLDTDEERLLLVHVSGKQLRARAIAPAASDGTLTATPVGAWRRGLDDASFIGGEGYSAGAGLAGDATLEYRVKWEGFSSSGVAACNDTCARRRRSSTG